MYKQQLVLLGIGAVGSLSSAWAADLSRMSLEELTHVQVTSVSKSPQQLNTAAAAIYVITREEIIRSGVLSIPEALRLAPNLQVEQMTSSSYAITARGFGDSRDVQTQANKLLILVDGRTVYSPLFSGVFYDAIDVVMDDIDRIEVISGPGATLWGANAMNGVINIITRSTADTLGTLLRFDSGNAEQAATARFGGYMGGDTGAALSYRIYGKAFDRDSLEFADGSSAHDRWSKRQAGMRVDFEGDGTALTISGDAFHADQDLLGAPGIANSGANVIGRWQYRGARSQLTVQGFWDHTEREAPADAAPFSLDTYDLEIQHSMSLGSAHRLVWGAGKRVNNYHITGIGPLQFRPGHRSLDPGNLFAQDTIALGASFKLTAGVKLEDNPYSGWDALPELRLAYAPDSTTLLWGAVSRGIRAPTPFDADVAEFLGPTLFLRGNPDFRSEKVWSYEIGYRGSPAEVLALSASVFYDDYDDLRSVELGPTGIPLLWGNLIEGHSYGLEVWGDIQVTPSWRLSPGVRTLHKRLHFVEGASGLLTPEQAGDDPTHQASLKSSLDFGRGVTFDAILRHVGDLPGPKNPDYLELSARLGWRISKSLEVAVSGFNLLDDRHTEYAPPVGREIERSALAELRLTF